jgi:two-component system response regulator (stage 0 sporulation protein F)
METEQRKHARIHGPFEGYRIGVIDARVTIYDLSEGGCFVNCATTAPETGRSLVLKIEIPDEGWVCLKSQALYAKPGYGFAVSFVEVPHEAAERLKRGMGRRQGLVPDPKEADADTIVDDDASAQPPGAKQILIADDDDGVRRIVRKALSTYRVQTARDVAQAIALYRKQPADLLITDYLMPDGTGSELISRLREEQPSLKVLLMTGHAAMLDQEGSHWWTTERHLGKPFTLQDLRSAVAELIGSP